MRDNARSPSAPNKANFTGYSGRSSEGSLTKSSKESGDGASEVSLLSGGFIKVAEGPRALRVNKPYSARLGVGKKPRGLALTAKDAYFFQT